MSTTPRTSEQFAPVTCAMPGRDRVTVDYSDIDHELQRIKRALKRACTVSDLLKVGDRLDRVEIKLRARLAVEDLISNHAPEEARGLTR